MYFYFNTALALAAIGTSFEDIIEDYGRSREGLDGVREDMIQEMSKDGLDASFADAPPEVHLFTYLFLSMRSHSHQKYKAFAWVLCCFSVQSKNRPKLHNLRSALISLLPRLFKHSFIRLWELRLNI